MSKTATHHGLVEWVIVKVGRRGIEARHSEGAQSIFGIQRARKVLKELGEPWQIRHVSDLAVSPPEED